MRDHFRCKRIRKTTCFPFGHTQQRALYASRDGGGGIEASCHPPSTQVQMMVVKHVHYRQQLKARAFLSFLPISL